MPDFEWTPQQELAINSKGSNILVSAAAGSGKTAVLVERVIRKITDKNNPVDLESLVIMTFTKAAAAQMRQKIFKAVRKALLEDPDNEHLKKQIVKVHTARICTIDSLCLDIVKENFQMVDVDPAFSVADEAEEKMLEEDILKNLLEEKYQAAEPDFMDLAVYYTEKSDSKLEDLILNLFRFAQSHPAPYGWLKMSILPYTGGTEMEWFKDLEKTIRDNIKEAGKMAEAGLKIAKLPNGPDKYIEPFEYIIEMCSHMSCLGYEDMGAAIKAEIGVWKDSPRYDSKKEEFDERLKNLARDTRKEIKEKLIDLRDKFYYAALPDMLKDMEKCAPIAQTIVNLTIEFSERLKAAKKDRKIADFSDIAHFALDVLIAHDEDGRILVEDNNICFTKIADMMASEIDEIIVDEYQDTNMLQEFIIMALSSERFGSPNVFMVGDVKQSIYSFRMACPELFMGKYDTYGKTDPNGQRIILDSNFRSRTDVIDFSNYIFRQIMTREATGIDYCDGNELTHKSTIPEKEGMTPEIIFIDGTASDARKAEGYEIARIIENIMKNGEVYDSDNEQYRPARFSDIALITRNTDNPQIEKILNERRIPMQKESGKGFFESFEIRLVMDLMSIIDNPYQDIPFAALLYSPVVGATADDLARIRILNREEGLSLYEACRKHGFFEWFLDRIAEWQRMSVCMPISDFLAYVIEDSGLMGILLAMPSGQSRKNNIEFLKSRADAFSRSSYAGLFNFIRYIKQLKDSDIDFGNAQGSDRFDAVKVMTIHKSKGLEFPYVIIGGYGKNFNKSDSSNSIILEREYGVGIEYRNQETKEKRNTIFMELLKTKARGSSVAEEMRVLYVALTRAKEKLYLVGSNNNTFSSADKKWSMCIYEADEQLSMQKVQLANSFMEMTGMALARHSCFADVFKERKIDTDPSNPLFNDKCSFNITLESFEDVESKRVEEIIDNSVTRKELEEMIAGDEQLDTGEYEKLKKNLTYQYPFHDATVQPVKKTASQLEKHPELTEEPDKDSEDEEKNSFKAYKGSALTGAERGNAYHRVFELIEYNSSEKAAEQIRKMQASGRISAEYAKAVDPKTVDAFIASSIGQRMAKAASAGKLFREQPFVCGHTEQIDGVDEMLLIQGIIDAFFEESGALVLVDYKTDRNRTEQELVETYKPQQDAYAVALTDAYQMPVKEMIIYSTSLGKEIRL
ncbi:MAG: helicase-exonuclease AddAB subunit AddA [Lachnospiraceae bacterium]|nr:helicase-exonuclease AddAB subunit AddA [Lachnospiraceae bacterium]